MGDVAPPLSCHLVTSTTGEPSSSPVPRSKKRQDRAIITDVDTREAVAKNDKNNNRLEIPTTTKTDDEREIVSSQSDNNNNRVYSGSYGASSSSFRASSNISN